jgi:hypothetical protein
MFAYHFNKRKNVVCQELSFVPFGQPLHVLIISYIYFIFLELQLHPNLHIVKMNHPYVYRLLLKQINRRTKYN